jgi:large subunit ribosomal protein L17
LALAGNGFAQLRVAEDYARCKGRGWMRTRNTHSLTGDQPQYRPTAEAGSKETNLMRHRNAGFKLGRNPSHRRALLRNLVTSIVLMDKVETTITKCKATQPLVEKMITLGKRGTVHARRQALSYLMTPESVDRLFSVVAPRYADRNGGYTRITRTGARQGDAAEMAYIELLGAEHELDERRQKRDEARAKKREEMAKQLEEQQAAAAPAPSAEA